MIPPWLIPLFAKGIYSFRYPVSIIVCGRYSFIQISSNFQPEFQTLFKFSLESESFRAIACPENKIRIIRGFENKNLLQVKKVLQILAFPPTLDYFSFQLTHKLYGTSVRRYWIIIKRFSFSNQYLEEEIIARLSSKRLDTHLSFCQR